VGRLLHEAGYSRQANSKTLEDAQHPDRDAQFRHIHDTVAAALAAGTPVVSTKPTAAADPMNSTTKVTLL
jgi:elongation factor P hydroxylase